MFFRSHLLDKKNIIGFNVKTDNINIQYEHQVINNIE